MICDSKRPRSFVFSNRTSVLINAEIKGVLRLIFLATSKETAFEL